MINTKTSAERTLELLKQAVGERGADFVFPMEWKMQRTGTCTYVQPNQTGPACIVGYVLHEYGVTLDELAAFEGLSAATVTIQLGVDNESAEILFDAQTRQDSGATWDDSYQYAANIYEARRRR